jgi:hypothetical protein
MFLRVSYRKKYEIFFLASLKSLKKDWDSELDPNLLVRGTDPRIRIRTKMSQIPNTELLRFLTISVEKGEKKRN